MKPKNIQAESSEKKKFARQVAQLFVNFIQ